MSLKLAIIKNIRWMTFNKVQSILKIQQGNYLEFYYLICEKTILKKIIFESLQQLFNIFES